MDHDPLIGCILGTAVGDAIGLPYESLPRRRGIRLLGEPDRHRLVFGYGMVSDDTEHTILTAQALISSANDEAAFTTAMGRQMRRWFYAVPTLAGMATLRSGIKLCLGVHPSRSGVFSAGNGPSMRSAILGAAITNIDQLERFVRISTRVTHTDPKAEYAAFAVALATRQAIEGTSQDGTELLRILQERLHGPDAEELISLLQRAVDSARRGESTPDFALAMGWNWGVTGYIYQTVPAALHAIWRHPNDFRMAVEGVIRCGGDTDSTAAIVGGVLGASLGKDGIPQDWLRGIRDWPRTNRWMEKLAVQLGQVRESGQRRRALRLPALPCLLRNVFVLWVVFVHVPRRALPPY